MTIRVYNTLSNAKEDFVPLEPGKVGMYVCGPTVYDSSHIGHARSVIVFDVIYRYLTARGFRVTYVRNFTDVDDKIIRRANELGISTEALAEKYIHEFHADMDALNNLRPSIEPRATAHIRQIIDMIEILFKKGYAYNVDGDIFFSVERFKKYGRLSGRRLEDMEAGARVEVDPRKSNPFDFVLWKSSKPDEPAWDSPWGKGRPGWHIECSAMSADYLGPGFDIHGGGKDLIFPHHENEIAQSEAAFDKTFVKYWLHNGFVNINQEKMSKSLGNFLMIKDILKSFHPEVLRIFLLSHHYRSPVDFSEQAMREAAGGIDKVYALLERIEKRLGRLPDPEAEPDADRADSQKDYWRLFCEAMDDDFNTAVGIACLFDAVRSMNRILDEGEALDPSGNNAVICSECADLLKMGRVLGMMLEPPGVYFERKRKLEGLRQSVDPEMIDRMVRERTSARRDRDFKKADQIRDRLKEMNIQIEDRPDGTIWKFIP